MPDQPPVTPERVPWIEAVAAEIESAGAKDHGYSTANFAAIIQRHAAQATEDAYRRGWEARGAADCKAVEATGKPGEGGIDITSGIPSDIYVGIGRGHYEDGNGEYELAKDVADSVRESAAAAIRALEFKGE